MNYKLFVLTLLLILLNILINFKDKSKLVFKENNFDYKIQTIDVSTKFINTKNIRTYFKSPIKIIGIYPKINKIYEYKLRNEIGYYKFSNNFETDIEIFTTKYKELLNKYGLYEEIVKIELNGIPLSAVRIYCSEKDLNKLF